jgi:geranylgeranyl transferase type-2 subunit beta
MATGFLEALDAQLAAGHPLLGRASAELTRGFVLSQQTPEGGFHGRRKAADPYYTDFALRILNLTGVEAGPLQTAASYLGEAGIACGDVVSAFSLLNAARILKGHGFEVPLDCGGIGSALLRQLLPDGSFSHSNDSQPSVYQTFLAALVHEIGGQRMLRIQTAASAIAGLRCSDGGYSDRPGEKTGQTNPTAAALAFLALANALLAREAADAVSFLTRMQASDGGLRAHAAAPAGDLLSTFTGLVALSGLGALDRLRLSHVVEFVAPLRLAGGGYRSCEADSEADVEYTYYGVGILSLLSAHLGAAKR